TLFCLRHDFASLCVPFWVSVPAWEHALFFSCIYARNAFPRFGYPFAPALGHKTMAGFTIDCMKKRACICFSRKKWGPSTHHYMEGREVRKGKERKAKAVGLGFNWPASACIACT